MPIFTTTHRDWDEAGIETVTPVTVTYSYDRGCPGGHDKYGAQTEPDTYESVEVESVMTERGVDLVGELDKIEMAEYEQQAMEHAHEAQEEADCDTRD